MIGSVKSGTGALANPKASQDDKLKAVARQFEAVFLRQMIGSMRQAKLSDDIMGSDATDQFRDMQDAHCRALQLGKDLRNGKGRQGVGPSVQWHEDDRPMAHDPCSCAGPRTGPWSPGSLNS